ncbi:MAG TPA: hypothetical protein VK665_10640 [Candidatus Elarobacter sp.]|nr:hypothetical protein [Candidatus Elarobacter sp.]
MPGDFAVREHHAALVARLERALSQIVALVVDPDDQDITPGGTSSRCIVRTLGRASLDGTEAAPPKAKRGRSWAR